MQTFDLEQFKADVWYYSGLEGSIKSDTWEQIVAHCVGGRVILGDHFMADVVNDKYCFNVKSIKEQTISKTGNKTIDFVQCRTPIVNDRALPQEELSQEILRTLDNKLQESLTTFEREKMIDVIILHKRYDNNYHASVYVQDHPDFNSYELIWSEGEGRLSAESPWLIKRRYSDELHRQTCTSIKKKYLKEDMIAEVMVESVDYHNISADKIMKEYKLSLGIHELQS
jgi:hypothetical protein